MDCVWRLSEATVRQVRENLRSGKPLAYNTVLTMLQILREKGFLASQRVGRTDVYHPLVSREQMARRSWREVADRFCAGSAQILVSQIVDEEDLTEEEIKTIRRAVNQKLRNKTNHSS